MLKTAENKSETKSRRQAFFKKHSSIIGTVIALLLMIVLQCIVIGINEGSVSEIIPKLWMSWLNILRNNVYTGVIAIGMCFTIVSGGIDLSVGSMLCAIGALIMYLIDESSGLLAALGITGVPAYIIAILVAIIAGMIFGGINGSLVAHGKIPPFIVTLGTMLIFRSVTQHLTRHFNPVIPNGFKQIASLKIGGEVVLPIIYWVAVVVIADIIFSKTAAGKKFIAVGSNEQAARYSGIKTSTVKRRVYVIGGVSCAIAAIIYVSRIGSMDFANAGSGYEMEAVAAVVVGGTSMSGGKGSVPGAFLGMLIVGAINNILNMLGVPTFLCNAVKGLIIIIAVLVQTRENNDVRKVLKLFRSKI